MTPSPPPKPPGSPNRPSPPPRPPALSRDRAARAEATFNAALDQSAPERAAFVTGACGDDADLHARVMDLLAAHERAEGFMQDATPHLSEIEEQFARLKPEEAGDHIGPYKLLQEIGVGGFGTVWMADQEQPVRRRVALKIIKMGMDTKEVISRFEQERQALAMMDHPNIARVFDAGTTKYGRPYFVMELVRGVKITDYCDEQGLSTDERIELFVHVCQAVQHAHQKGIIHRDLKPSNILVTINDGEAVPKVIDFGVAKATQGHLTDGTLFTKFEQMIGTPLYMSPEQAEMTSLDVDTRSDIYALGVLLYELLTGRTPIDTVTMARAGMDEIRRLIREVDPPRPSQRLKTLDGNELTTMAKRRHTEAAKLPGSLRGDLDWIVMKCLEKDRKRRYDTANGLALDLQRHLKNEVVIARPPTTAYLLSKLVKRNKSAVAAGCTVVMTLIAGFGVAVWQANRAKLEAERAKTAEQHSAAALDELRATAPAFSEQARALAAKEQFADAIEKLDYALKLRPDAVEYLVAKGDLLQCQLKLAEAAAVYREALRVKPGLARAEGSAKLCEELLAAPLSAQGKLTRENLAKLHLAMQRQQRPAAELMPVARLLGEEQKLLLEYWLARLKDLPVSADKPLKDRLAVREDGGLGLNLSGTKVIDLAPLADAPLTALNVSGSEDLVDLSPLRGMALVALNLQQTSVADLAPLSGMHTLKYLYLNGSKVTDLAALSALRLEQLDLMDTRIFDLTALREMKLTHLNLRNTRVANISPLAAMPLTFFDATAIPAIDYSPLVGAPLEKCIIQSTPVRDLSFLKNSPVKELTLFGCTEARGFGVLASLKSLDLLILPQNFRNLPDEELAAIGALRAHPTLRNIQSEFRSGGGWIINSTQSKDDFWKAWDREQAVTRVLRDGGFKFSFTPLDKGGYRLEVIDQPLSDLSFLKGVLITELILNGTAVKDLRPLEGLALTRLDIRKTPVTDLTPLRDPVLSASLKMLELWQIPATDFSPISACKNLDWFDASGTALTDLGVVRGCRLKVALLGWSKITDISVLAGMPLERITLSATDVTDLSPLLKCPTLAELVLPNGAKDVRALRALPSLARLSFDHRDGGFSKQSAAEFWIEDEHGGLTAAGVSILAEESAGNPRDSILALRVAMLQAWFGKDAEHAATCRRMIERAERGDLGDPRVEQAVKSWCARVSDDATMLQRVLSLARQGAGAQHRESWEPTWFELGLGLAEFRAGDYQAAESAFLRAGQLAETDNWDPPNRPIVVGVSRYFRAMILSKQGKTEDAQKLFREAEAQMPPLPAGDGTLLPRDVNQDQLLHWLAYKEAAAVLQLPLLNQMRPVAAVLLPPTSEWKWLHPLDGTDPAESAPDFHTTFASLSYDDGHWKTGKDSDGPRSGFGYGEEHFIGVDIGKPIAADLAGTAYFRTRFTTNKPHTHLELRCQRDDGIIVYLDGKEVARDNMSDGPGTYQLRATRKIDRPEEVAIQRIPLTRVSLPAGDHVLAISVHNHAKSSTDLRLAGITLVELEPPPSPKE